MWQWLQISWASVEAGIIGALIVLIILRLRDRAENAAFNEGFKELFEMAMERGLPIAHAFEAVTKNETVVLGALKSIAIFTEKRCILTLTVQGSVETDTLILEHGPRMERKTASFPIHQWRRAFNEIKSILRPFPTIKPPAKPAGKT